MATGSIEFPFSQEIVDLICSHLHEKRDIQSARLVCRAFNAAARGFFYSAGQSPSLLFGDIRTDFLSESAALASSEAFVEPGNYTPEAFTLWTWLDVPANINFEDPLDDVGNTFTKLLIEPFDSKLNPGAKLNHGRKGICWGRIKDSPNSFCIVTNWHSPSSLIDYTKSENCANLKNFIESVAPGCTRTSSSQLLHFKRWL